MFFPNVNPEKRRDEPSKKKILEIMKRFCRDNKVEPLEVFDHEKGIYFIFPLPDKKDQQSTNEEIWEGDWMKNIRQDFSEDYTLLLKKCYYDAGFWQNFRIGQEKLLLFIGIENVDDFVEVYKGRKDRIDFSQPKDFGKFI